MRKSETRRQAAEEKLRKTEISLSSLKKNLTTVEKTIRDAEANIEQKMTLNFIRRIAKVFAGVVIIFGFTLFVIGIIALSLVSQDPPIAFMGIDKMFIWIFTVIIGVIMTLSGLLHLDT